MFNRNESYLITGGSGFLGRALLDRLILFEGFSDLTILGRDEGKLIEVQNKHQKIKIITGDISDPVICAQACKGVTGIFHLAAFKHVGLAETQAYQCTMTNVVGTLNLLKETTKNKIDFFIHISTDKVAQIRGVYGASKYINEKTIQSFAQFNKNTHYSIIRYGNVLGSTGSFLTKWRPLMEYGRTVTITDRKATRFFFTVNEAVDLILNALYAPDGTSCQVTIPKMKAVSMGVALEACQEVYGDCPVNEIGLQPGENMHETIDGVTFSNEVEQYTKQEFKDLFLCHTK